jgi:hypothetical protein
LDFNTVNGFTSTVKRQQYLNDMRAIREGRQAYYSLGGDDRLTFGRVFTLLDRRMQDSFIAAATRCMQENRIMTGQHDLNGILRESQGKRDQRPDAASNDHQQYMQGASKRPRESYFWLKGIHCFD